MNSSKYLIKKIFDSLNNLKNDNLTVYNKIKLMKINDITLDCLKPIILPDNLTPGLIIDDNIPTNIIEFYDGTDKLFHIEIKDDFKFQKLNLN
jgi:hypothetical protein